MVRAITNVSAIAVDETRRASRCAHPTAFGLKVAASTFILMMAAPSGLRSSAHGAEFAQRSGENSTPVLSGQLIRISDANAPSCERTNAETTDPVALDAAMKRQMVHLARLQADIDGDEIVLPAALQQARNSDPVAAALRDEKLALAAGREALASQLEPLDLDKALVEEEIEVAKGKQSVVERQEAILQRQLHDLDGLASKGLATIPQRLALDQNLLLTEDNRLDLKLSLLKAQQDLSKVVRSMADLHRQARNATLMERNQTEDALAAYSRQARATPDQLRDRGHGDKKDVLYLLVRDTAGSLQAFPVTTATTAPGEDSARRRTDAEPSAMIAEDGR
jgi:chromosome segregation ATPase